MKCLQKVKAALLTVIDAGKLYHLEALKAEYPYCVWAEDGAGEQQNGDNYMILQSVQGTIDYYTRDEYDPVVDAILNQKYAQACAVGIQMDFAINDLAKFPLSNKETVVVLSNLLDNAIEACKTQNGTRLIRVKIQCSEEKTILSVINTIDKAPVVENGLPVTTKADPLMHGYGLQNIVSILAEHGACPAISCRDGWFQFSTVLFQRSVPRTSERS